MFETVEGLGRYPVRLLTRPVFAGGQITNLLQVGMSLESVTIARRRFLLAMAAVLPLALLLASGGGGLPARPALPPPGRVTEAARPLSAAQLSAPLGTTGGHPGLGRPSRRLNPMPSPLDAG